MALRERFTSRMDGAAGHSSLHDTAAAARSLGFAFSGGAVIAIASMILPQPPGTNVIGLFAIFGAALLVGAFLLLRGSRVVNAEISAALLLGTLLVSLAIHFTEERTAVYSLFYVWIALESVYFLSRRAALLQLVVVAAALAVLLRVERPPAAEEQWFITVGTVAMVGVLVGALKSNIERLIGRLADAAHTDPLTELGNRRGFQEMLEVELDRARRTGLPVSLLVADLDHFKRVNDRLGHPAGDRVLKRFAAQMQRLARRVDEAARLGGEEFALLLPEAAKHDAFLVAERLRRAVRAGFADDPVPLTVSIGVACHPDDADSPEALLRAGDEALYTAKQLGRDRSVLFKPAVASELSGDQPAPEPHLPGQLSAVLLLAETIDARDSGAARHSQAVGRHARAIAVELGLPPGAVERIALAGVLHDVGKIGVSDAILQKPSGLDEDEWTQIRKHPELGARILAGANLEDIAEWVFAHHERPDGGGYPLGLWAEQIPLEARILAVAGAYAAMTSDRPYRAAMSHTEAAAELRRCAGSQFDPQVVAALLAASGPEATRAAAVALPRAL